MAYRHNTSGTTISNDDNNLQYNKHDMQLAHACCILQSLRKCHTKVHVHPTMQTEERGAAGCLNIPLDAIDDMYDKYSGLDMCVDTIWCSPCTSALWCREVSCATKACSSSCSCSMASFSLNASCFSAVTCTHPSLSQGYNSDLVSEQLCKTPVSGFKSSSLGVRPTQACLPLIKVVQQKQQRCLKSCPSMRC